MMKRTQGAGTLPVIALLFFVLVVAGGVNYYRNWSAEQVQERERPFGPYSDADLENLADAYASELKGWTQRYARSKAARGTSSDQRSMEGNIAQFERMKKASSALKELNSEIGQREARLREIRSEQSYRVEQAGTEAHIRRLTSL